MRGGSWPDADLPRLQLLCRLLGIEQTRDAQRDFSGFRPLPDVVRRYHTAPSPQCDLRHAEAVAAPSILDRPIGITSVLWEMGWVHFKRSFCLVLQCVG
jgi:hypothetical protein